FLSLSVSWITKINTRNFNLSPFSNLAFCSVIVGLALFYLLAWIDKLRNSDTVLKDSFFNFLSRNSNFLFFFLTTFFLFQIEIHYYWRVDSAQSYQNALNIDFFFPNQGNKYVSNASTILFTLFYFNLIITLLKNRFKTSESQVLVLIF